MLDPPPLHASQHESEHHNAQSGVASADCINTNHNLGTACFQPLPSGRPVNPCKVTAGKHVIEPRRSCSLRPSP